MPVKPSLSRPISASNSKLQKQNSNPIAFDSSSLSGNYQQNQVLNFKARPTSAITKGNLPGSSKSSALLKPQLSILDQNNIEDDMRYLEKIPRSTASSLNIQKLLPKKVIPEKEKIYEENIKIKQNINQVTEENFKLKARNLQLEKENMKLQKTLENSGQPVYGSAPDPSIIINLKKQVNELREEIKLKNDELEDMKRSTKFTKFKEVEIELRAYIEENARLKALLDQQMFEKYQRNLETGEVEEGIDINSDAAILQRENAKLQAELKYLEDQNQNLQNSLDLEMRHIQVANVELSRLKKYPRIERDKDSARGFGNGQKYKDDNYRKDENSPKEGKLRREAEEYKRTLREKDDLIDFYRKQVDDLSIKLQLKQKYIGENEDHNEGRIEYLRLKDQYNELQNRYKALISINEEEELASRSKIERKATPPLPEPKIRKIKRVNADDVKSSGIELGYTLKLKRIPLNHILKLFDRLGKPTLSISEMKDLLSKDPFKLAESTALLIARYFIEPNDEPYINYDPERSQDVVVIKSIFKSFVNNYNLPNEIQELEHAKAVHEFVKKYKDALIRHYNNLPNSRTGYLTPKEILDPFRILDLGIPSDYADYLIMCLYNKSKNMNELEYMAMFDLMEFDNIKKLQDIIQGNVTSDYQNFVTFQQDDNIKFEGKNEIVVNKLRWNLSKKVCEIPRNH